MKTPFPFPHSVRAKVAGILLFLFSAQLAGAQETFTVDLSHGVVYSRKFTSNNFTFILQQDPDISDPNIEYEGRYEVTEIDSRKYLMFVRQVPGTYYNFRIRIEDPDGENLRFRINSLSVYVSPSTAITHATLPDRGSGQIAIYGNTVGGGIQSVFPSISSINGDPLPVNPPGASRDANGFVKLPLGNFWGENTYFTEIQISLPAQSTANTLILDNINMTVDWTNFSIDDVSALEASPLTFTVSRSDNLADNSVIVESIDNTATSPSDYLSLPKTTIHFPAGGPLSQTITVDTKDDNLSELDETFEMVLSEAVGARIEKGIGVGTIMNRYLITETFENETENSQSFTEENISFSLSGALKVYKEEGSGSDFSHNYITTLPHAYYGTTVGEISIVTPDYAFMIHKLDARVFGHVDEVYHFIGNVTFTGTLYDGTTVSVQKEVSRDFSGGPQWRSDITFDGTALENKLLTSLKVVLPDYLGFIEIDNFTFIPVSLGSEIRVSDISSQLIESNSAPSTTNGTDFGKHCGLVSIERTFTIYNYGLEDLDLTSPLNLTGDNADQFTITQYPDNKVTPRGHTTFSIRYQPNTPGNHLAGIIFSTNDPIHPEFLVNLKGAASDGPLEVTSAPTNRVIVYNGSPLDPVPFEVEANNALSYEWQIKLGEGDFNSLSESENFTGVSTDILTIDSPDISYHNAVFRCLVTGCSSSETSSEATLRIIGPHLPLASGELDPLDVNAGKDEGWTYYTDGDMIGFAIHWGENSAKTKASAKVTITEGSIIEIVKNTEKALYVSGRYWNVEADPLESPVKIRFYLREIDRLPVLNSAAYFSFINEVSLDGFKWFKTNGVPFDPETMVSENGIAGNAILLTGTEEQFENLTTCVEFEDITSFSGGTLFASAGFGDDVLPVNLISFTLHKTDDGGIEARWATSSEINAGHFLLERSADARHFETVGTVKAAGSTEDLKHYRFRDVKPLIGINYYRLTEVAEDGSISRFPIQSIVIEEDSPLKIYPNPVTSRSFTLTTDRTVESITIWSLTGRKISASHTLLSGMIFKVTLPEQLPAGVYLISVKEESGIETIRRLVVQ